MRTSFILASLVASLAACSPYDPDLGGAPYRCAPDSPRCPEGYFCESSNGMGADVCVSIADGRPDAAPDMGGGGFVCADDSSIEGSNGNNTIQNAFVTPVSQTRAEQTYAQLAICPEGDKDFFQLTATAGKSIEVSAESDQGQPVIVAILGSSGQTLAAGQPVGSNGSRAFIASAPAGNTTYYAQVSAAAQARANYHISIKVQ